MAKFKIKDIVAGAEQLSLGVSIVVAILLGTGLGYLVKKATNFTPALWIGFAIGIAAAILNVYKAYKAQVKSLDELKDEARYKGYKKDDDDEDESTSSGGGGGGGGGGPPLQGRSRCFGHGKRLAGHRLP